MPEFDRRIAELGEFIKGQRQTSQLSLRRLGELAGVSNPYLSQIERGLRKPSAEILQQIAKALQISSETLFERAGWIDPESDERGGVREAISLDQRLTDDQRQILISVYESFIRSSTDGSPTTAG